MDCLCSQMNEWSPQFWATRVFRPNLKDCLPQRRGHETVRVRGLICLNKIGIKDLCNADTDIIISRPQRADNMGEPSNLKRTGKMEPLISKLTSLYFGS